MDQELFPEKELCADKYGTIFFGRVSDGRTHNCRCMNCGKLMFKYDGNLEAIFLDGGIVPKSASFEEHKCGRCGYNWRIVKM